MATVLNSNGINASIDRIIDEAEEFLILVSPYLKISDYQLAKIRRADERKVKIAVIHGKEELKPAERKKLDSLRNLNLYYLQNLHAKSFLNEKEVIMGSMNLYEFSQANNWELAILLYEDDDEFENLLIEVDAMIESSEILIESFKTQRLVKPRFHDRISNLMNDYYEFNKFHNVEPTYSNVLGSVDYTNPFCSSFPMDNVDVEIKNAGRRIDFILNIDSIELKKLNELLDIRYKNDVEIEDYRCYQNFHNRISLYVTIEQRNAWAEYTDAQRIEAIANGIKLMHNHLKQAMEKLKHTPNAEVLFGALVQRRAASIAVAPRG